MNTGNTIGKWDFIIEHIWWMFISWIWYKSILFRCLCYRSLKDSRMILLGTVFACCGLGILLEIKRQRNAISVLMNLLAGYGIYTTLTYYPIRRKPILIVLSTATILSAVYSLIILCHKTKRKKTKRILKQRIIKAGMSSRNLFCTSMATIMLLIGFNAIFGTALITPSTTPTKQSNITEQTIANNLNTLCLLWEDTWSTLSVDEKLNVLQTIANIEQHYLGLPNELNVGAANLSEGLTGYYSDSNPTVTEYFLPQRLHL